MGVPEEEARYYDEEFQAGRTLVTVKANARYQEAAAILRRHEAYDVESRGGRGTGAPRADMAMAPRRADAGRTAEIAGVVGGSAAGSRDRDEISPTYRQN